MHQLNPSFSPFQDELQAFNLAKFSQILTAIGWQDSLQTHSISPQQPFCHGRIMARRLQTNISYIVYDVFNQVEFTTTDIWPAGCYINLYTGKSTVEANYDQQLNSVKFSANKSTIIYSQEPITSQTVHLKNTSLSGLTILIDDSIDTEVSKQIRRLLQPEMTIRQQAIPTSLRTSLQELLNMSWQPQLTRFYADGLILQSIAKLLSTPPPNESGLPAAQIKQLQLLQEMLQQKPAQKHSIVELALKFGMSPSVLQRKFKQYFGITLFQYLKNIRMNAAALLLEQGHSVQEAAYCAGYSYPENFSAAFKTHFGYSPKVRS